MYYIAEWLGMTTTKTTNDKGDTMKWNHEPKTTDDRHTMRAHGVTLSIDDASGDASRRWQGLVMSLGEHSTQPAIECLTTWPREAIAKAREALDSFEASLENES